MWRELTSVEEVNENIDKSRAQSSSFVLFKHSTRCSISSMVKSRVQRTDFGELPVYVVHVIESRPVSNFLEERFQIPHESPQAIVVKNGEAVFHASHTAIHADELIRSAN